MEVVFSKRAMTALLVETREKITTETGGVFLGKYESGVWYIVETIDPGPNSIFKPAYFEYDQDYMENVMLGDSEEEDVSLAIIYQDALDVIYGAVDRLPQEYRELFRMSFEQGLKNTEIARLLSVSEVTVIKRKARLIERLRRMLGKDIDCYLIFFLLAA